MLGKDCSTLLEVSIGKNISHQSWFLNIFKFEGPLKQVLGPKATAQSYVEVIYSKNIYSLLNQ